MTGILAPNPATSISSAYANVPDQWALKAGKGTPLE
jgi:hypothetical protein